MSCSVTKGLLSLALSSKEGEGIARMRKSLKFVAMLPVNKSHKPAGDPTKIEQIFDVVDNNDRGGDPGKELDQRWVDELAHFLTVIGEKNQGIDGKGDL